MQEREIKLYCSGSQLVNGKWDAAFSAYSGDINPVRTPILNRQDYLEDIQLTVM